MIDSLIQGIPKAELHVHIEGTLEPSLMDRLARRNGISLPVRAAAAERAACRFRGLAHFLRLYYEAIQVLRTEQDFYELTAAYLERARRDGVRHAEISFDPQSHLVRGVPFHTMIEGMGRAIDEAWRRHGISASLIMSFLRDRSPAEAMELLSMALPHRERIVAVGLDSAEIDHPPREFATVFSAAHAAGFAAVAHAGEEGPAAYVVEALDRLRVQRVDHGVSAAADPALIERLRDQKITLTMCPLSNLRLGVVPSLSAHPLKRLLDAGVRVTVNSDDPAYFCGYLADNYLAAHAALDLSEMDIRRLAANSISGSFLSRTRKDELLAEVKAFEPATGGQAASF